MSADDSRLNAQAIQKAFLQHEYEPAAITVAERLTREVRDLTGDDSLTVEIDISPTITKPDGSCFMNVTPRLVRQLPAELDPSDGA